MAIEEVVLDQQDRESLLKIGLHQAEAKEVKEAKSALSWLMLSDTNDALKDGVLTRGPNGEWMRVWVKITREIKVDLLPEGTYQGILPEIKTVAEADVKQKKAPVKAARSKSRKA